MYSSRAARKDTVSETRIVRRARFHPLSTAVRSVRPSLTSSRSRSKKITNESAVMPIATMRPAMPASDRVKFWYLLSSTTDRNVSAAEIARLKTDTSARPSAAAIRPASSWFLPSWGETEVVLRRRNVSGSAPYFSSSASWVACCWPPMLLIRTWPPGMACWVSGADTTLPSSTMAVESSAWSLGLVLAPLKYLLYWLDVSVLKALAALPLSVRLTTHWLLVVSIPAFAEVTSVPSTTALPSANL